MTTYLLIRHALTDSVVSGRLAGRLPGTYLNDEGRAQAEDLAARMAPLPVRAIYSSPLDRAVETARVIGRRLRLEVQTDEIFAELDFGDWTGKNFGELEEDAEWRRFNSFRSCTRIPRGELMIEAQARIIAGLEKFSRRHPIGLVAVVSHADLIKAALAHYAGIHLDLFQRVEISPASVSVVSVGEETARIVSINHIGDLANYQNFIGS